MEEGREGRSERVCGVQHSIINHKIRYTLRSSSSAVDAFEPKTMVTRKLRRRHYEPLPIPEKRRKLAPLSSLVYVLDEHEVDDDLKVIFKVSSVLHNCPDTI